MIPNSAMTPRDLAQRLREASTSRDVALGFIPEAHADLLRAAAEALEQSEYFLDLTRKEHLAAERERDVARQALATMRAWLVEQQSRPVAQTPRDGFINGMISETMIVALEELDRLLAHAVPWSALSERIAPMEIR